jgi:hypothetical protein
LIVIGLAVVVLLPLLLFFVRNNLTELNRHAVSICRHPAKVLHAVTAITEDTRKSLFVVDQSNGLGEEGVVCVNIAHVTAFLAARESASKGNDTPMVSLCVVCQDKLSAFILLPCGHFCVCACCAGHIKNCPLCRKKIKTKRKIFV